MEPDFLLNRLTQDRFQNKTDEGHLDIKNIRERFLNALKEIDRIEKALEEKNTMLAISTKEKNRLIHAVNKAFEDKKRLHDRLADFDVLRNMEIAELKQGIERITIEKNHLLKESESLVEDLFKRDKTIDELRSEIERKIFQLKNTQDDLLTAIETMRRTESKYKEIEAKYRVIKQERDSLKKKLNMDIGQQDIRDSENIENTEYKRLIATLSSEKEAVEIRLSEALGRISSLEAKNAEYLRELSSKAEIFSELRQQMESGILKYQATIEKLTAEKDDLNLKLTDANKKAVSPTFFSDSQFFIGDIMQPSTTLNEPLTRRYPSMMIYKSPSRFEWIKKFSFKFYFFNACLRMCDHRTESR